MHLTVTSTLQRIFSLNPNLALLFQPSGYPTPAQRVPDALKLDFMDTRPVIFRSEAFDEDLLPAPLSA